MRTAMMESAFARAIQMVFKAVDGVDNELKIAQKVYAELEIPFDIDNLASVGLDRCFNGPEGACFCICAKSTTRMTSIAQAESSIGPRKQLGPF